MKNILVMALIGMIMTSQGKAQQVDPIEKSLAVCAQKFSLHETRKAGFTFMALGGAAVGVGAIGFVATGIDVEEDWFLTSATTTGAAIVATSLKAYVAFNATFDGSAFRSLLTELNNGTPGIQSQKIMAACSMHNLKKSIPVLCGEILTNLQSRMLSGEVCQTEEELSKIVSGLE